ncbi:MAG: four helix bundle protein [Patescibacteria group bacterium]
MYLQSYKELKVWQKSIDLVEDIYILTDKLPKEETYSLSIQKRRAAISIPSNIAEGQRRKNLPEFLQFLRIADASSAELETQIVISKRLYPNLDYLKTDKLLEEVQKMLGAMIRSLELKAKSLKLKANSGYLMVELMIAITIATIGVLSIAGFISRTLSVNRVVSDQFTANYLAMEGIEIVKNIIDANVIECLDKKGAWNKGGFSSGSKCREIDYQADKITGLNSNPTSCPDGSTHYLLFDSANKTYNYDSGVPTRFLRTVQITPIDANDEINEIQVNSIVKWTTRGGGPHSINLEDHFFNWLCP